MTRSEDSTRYRRDTLENLDGLAQIAQFGVSPEVRDRGPFGFDLRKAFWPYWLHALTRHRWRRSRAAALAFSLYPF